MGENETLLYVIITAITTVVASGGFWNYLDRRRGKQSISNKLLIGLAHDRIWQLANTYICKGWVTPQEFENLNDYLVRPYLTIGGNGTVVHLMDQVMKLPFVLSTQNGNALKERKSDYE